MLLTLVKADPNKKWWSPQAGLEGAKGVLACNVVTCDWACIFEAIAAACLL